MVNSSFDFAYSVLFQGKENNVPYTSRDNIFKSVLDKAKSRKPHFVPYINIFQIGAIETFDFQFRVGSGWSDIFFGQYIKQNGGGMLTVCDINLNHIAHSLLAANSLGYPIEAVYGNAIDHIKGGYDIYYLDGSNDPAETLAQFQKIEHTNAIVMVDDFTIKGTSLKLYLEDKKIGYQSHDILNGFAVIDLGKNDERIR